MSGLNVISYIYIYIYIHIHNIFVAPRLRLQGPHHPWGRRVGDDLHKYMYTYTSLSLYIYIYMNTHLYLPLSLSMYIYIYIYVYTLPAQLGFDRGHAAQGRAPRAGGPLRRNMYIYIYIYTCVYEGKSYIYIYIFMHIHIYVYVCMYILHMCIYIYIYMGRSRRLPSGARAGQQVLRTLRRCVCVFRSFKYCSSFILICIVCFYVYMYFMC